MGDVGERPRMHENWSVFHRLLSPNREIASQGMSAVVEMK